MRRSNLPALVLALLTSSCSDDGVGPGGDPPPEPPPVLTELPERLSELDESGAVAYEPAWELWSNGLAKERRVLLPAGARIELADRDVWGFPEGTLLLKTFSAGRPEGGTRPIETRVLWRRAGAWRMAVYLWSEDGSDAALIEGFSRTPVAVTDENGRSFKHLVPNRGDCIACHAASPAFVLGFGELQLNARHGGTDQLRRLESQGLFAQPLPENPRAIEADDGETEWVMGYLTANCVHCHNGSPRFSLAHDVFRDSVVGARSLVVPGDAEASTVYTRLRDGVMPPVGVQVPDSASIQRLRTWIETLDPVASAAREDEDV